MRTMNDHDIPDDYGPGYDSKDRMSFEDKVERMNSIMSLEDVETEGDVFLERKEAAIPSPPDLDDGFSKLVVYMKKDADISGAFWCGIKIESSENTVVFTGPLDHEEPTRERFQRLEKLMKIHVAGSFPTVEALSEELSQIGIYSRRVQNDI